MWCDEQELKGQTVSLDGTDYKWTCIAMVQLDVKKALTKEMQVAAPGGNQVGLQGCAQCLFRAVRSPLGSCDSAVGGCDSARLLPPCAARR
jgi:hypothetical protein